MARRRMHRHVRLPHHRGAEAVQPDTAKFVAIGITAVPLKPGSRCRGRVPSRSDSGQGASSAPFSHRGHFRRGGLCTGVGSERGGRAGAAKRPGNGDMNGKTQELCEARGFVHCLTPK